MTSMAVLPSVGTLVSGLVDYAGLFPPASLDLPTALRNYAAYQVDEHWPLLGRFVVPASRLTEMSGGGEGSLPRRRADEPWPVAALIGADAKGDGERIVAFNAQCGNAQVVAAEAKTGTVSDLEPLLASMPPAVEVFVEVPLAPDPAPLLGALARRGARAKVRTGGVTPEAIPSTAEVARFLVAAAGAGVAFKATAGLHHAVRGEYALTYDPGSPRAVMHGFLNVFVAAGLIATGATEAEALAVLEETDAHAFQFGPGGLRWRERPLPTSQLRSLRQQFARSFGSCSFREPVDELRALRLL